MEPSKPSSPSPANPDERTDYLSDHPVLVEAREQAESPNAVLSAAIRRLNARLAELPPERLADQLDEWHESWALLTEQRAAAADRSEELALIEAWAAYWAQQFG